MLLTRLESGETASGSRDPAFARLWVVLVGYTSSERAGVPVDVEGVEEMSMIRAVDQELVRILVRERPADVLIDYAPATSVVRR